MNNDKLINAINDLAAGVSEVAGGLNTCTDALLEIADALGETETDPGPEPGPDPDPGNAARPAESKGFGCFVVGRYMYDGFGYRFTIQGTNKCHQDLQSPALGKTKSNATRWIARQEPWIHYSAGPWSDATTGKSGPGFAATMQNQNIGGTVPNKCIQIPGLWEGTCKGDQSLFDEMVKTWCNDAAYYQANCEEWMILNIANEWGQDEAKWRDAYVAAIPRLRAAGWNGCIMVDAPGCAQNGLAIAHHGAAILAADPQKNVCFSWHIYGAVYDSLGGVPKTYAEQVDLVPTMDALYKTGLCIVIGEFGPGRGIGPSPTVITPSRIVSLCNEREFGFMSWAWEDGSGDDWFSHLKDPNKDELGDNLSKFGTEMVNNHWMATKKARIFG